MTLWRDFSEHASPVVHGGVKVLDGERWIASAGRAGTAASPPPRSISRRIIFLNRFFFPDHSATSQMLTDLAFHLAGRGHDVRVVTSRQRYDDPSAALPAAEVIGGVSIRRVATTRFGRSGLIGRGFDYLSFYTAACQTAVAWAKPGDLLVVKTDPPLLSVVAMRAVKHRGLCFVNWLQDLYPEIAVALGVPIIEVRLVAKYCDSATSHCRQLTPMSWLANEWRKLSARAVSRQSASTSFQTGATIRTSSQSRLSTTRCVVNGGSASGSLLLIREISGGGTRSKPSSPRPSGSAPNRVSAFFSLAAEENLAS